MSTRDLQRCAYTVECFLRACRWPDDAARVAVEAEVVGLFAEGRRGDCAILHRRSLTFYRQGQPLRQWPAPDAVGERPVWCDGKRISAIAPPETEVLSAAGLGALVLVGTAGLPIGPNRAAGAWDPNSGAFEDQDPRRKDQAQGSNNNNNNNNNNNG